MRHFSLWKTIKNDRLVNTCLIWFLMFSVFLVLNLGFGINLGKHKVYYGRDYIVANIEVVFAGLTFLISAIRIFLVLYLLHTGEEYPAKVLTKNVFYKGRAKLKVAYQIEGEHFEKEVTMENSADSDKLLENGLATVIAKKTNPKRIIIAELYSTAM
ncbi:hypothetical protein [Treponema sp.]|uniref:hypothetical protein n=1 Tax=Treponema sp. TaxID=166 RepID=UPI00298E8F96|nr:hypothetical protein [Treponema sp.]MCR5613822.1 hypothetical protein [Treponema sp.]